MQNQCCHANMKSVQSKSVQYNNQHTLSTSKTVKNEQDSANSDTKAKVEASLSLSGNAGKAVLDQKKPYQKQAYQSAEMQSHCCDPNMKPVYTKIVQSKNQSTSSTPKTIRNEQDSTYSEHSYIKRLEVSSETLHGQKLQKERMQKNHKSMKMCTYQCTVCNETCPLKIQPKGTDKYICASREIAKTFSIQN